MADHPPAPADARAALSRLIVDRAVVPGRVTLASGREADYYVDLRRVTLSAQAAPLVGEVMLDLVADLMGDSRGDFEGDAVGGLGGGPAAGAGVDAVGGLTMGADPVAAAMLHAAARRGRALDAFVVRKTTKDHGLQRRIEGPSVAGRRVIAVEDTSTTGGSVLVAVEALREVGADVVAVAVLVDRQTGAAERIAAEGLQYRAAYGLADLGLAPQ